MFYFTFNESKIYESFTFEVSFSRHSYLLRCTCIYSIYIYIYIVYIYIYIYIYKNIIYIYIYIYIYWLVLVICLLYLLAGTSCYAAKQFMLSVDQKNCERPDPHLHHCCLHDVCKLLLPQYPLSCGSGLHT